MKLRGTDIAMIGIMAALIVAAGYIPIIPIFGTGYTISLGSVLIQVVAVILGPFLAMLTVLFGSFGGMVMTGQGLQLLFFLPATIGALTTALLVFGRVREALVVMGCSLLLWYLSPLGIELWYYPYMMLAVFLMILALSPFIHGRSAWNDKYQYPLLIVFCSAGVLCDHLLGSMLAMFPPFELPAEAYRFILFIYPIERMVISLVSATVAVPVLRALRSLYFPITGSEEEIHQDTMMEELSPSYD